MFLLSCNDPGTKEGILVQGRIGNARDIKVVFGELDADAIHNLDSLILDDIGLFRFTCTPKEDGFFFLRFGKESRIILLPDEGEEIFVEADLGRQLFSYTVKGSPGSEILQKFNDQTTRNLSRIDSLRSILMQNRESPGFYQLSLSFDTLFQNIIRDQKLLEKRIIEQNRGSLAALLILNYQFGGVQVLNMNDDLSVYQELDSILSAKYPGNKHVLFHHQRVIEHQKKENDKEIIKK